MYCLYGLYLCIVFLTTGDMASSSNTTTLWNNYRKCIFWWCLQDKIIVFGCNASCFFMFMCDGLYKTTIGKTLLICRTKWKRFDIECSVSHSIIFRVKIDRNNDQVLQIIIYYLVQINNVVPNWDIYHHFFTFDFIRKNIFIFLDDDG